MFSLVALRVLRLAGFAVDWGNLAHVAPVVATCALGSAAMYYYGCARLEREYYGRRRADAASWKCKPTKWLAPDRHAQRFFRHHDDDVVSLAVHPDGRHVATGQCGRNPAVLVWDAGDPGAPAIGVRVVVGEAEGAKGGDDQRAFSSRRSTCGLKIIASTRSSFAARAMNCDCFSGCRNGPNTSNAGYGNI